MPKNNLGVLALLLLLVFLYPANGTSATWTVPSEVAEIQAAIDTAASGDTVMVLPGTYSESLFLFDKNIVLLGRDGSEVTSLIGTGNNNSCILQVGSIDSTNAVDSTTFISGFTFMAGVDSAGFGGGILCEGENVSPIIEGNCFRDNLALCGGGIAVSFLAAPKIRLNEFFGNTALQNGGGIASRLGAAPEIEDNLFISNVAQGQGGQVGQGGALALGLFSSSGSVMRNVLVRNDAHYGGGVAFLGGNWLLSGNTISFNTSTGSEPFRPAGVRVDFATVNISNNIVSHNATGWGIQATQFSSVTLSCNDFWGNELGNYNNLAPGAGDFSENPLFCNAISDDFHLSLASPCVPESTGCGLVGALGVGCGVLSVPDERTRRKLPFQVVYNKGLLEVLVLENPGTLGKVEIFLFDVAGRRLGYGTADFQRGSTVTIPARSLMGIDLPSGVYLVELRFDRERFAGKVRIVK